MWRRQPQDHAPGIAAVELNHVARDRIEQHVGPERAARERTASTLGGEEQSENDQLSPRLIELRGVKGDAERCSIDRCGRIREGDGPRDISGLAETATGHEAAESSHHVTQRDAGRKDITRRPERQALTTDIPDGNDDGQDQPHRTPPDRASETSSAGFARSTGSRRRATSAWRRQAR